MNQTYNPVLETVELSRFRLLAPVRAPAMGTALVLERAQGSPVVVEPGDRVPDPRLGNYRVLHRVDTANRGLSFTDQVPSSDAAFPFTVTVTFGCRVVDPVVVARDRITDMTAALKPSILDAVRFAAVRHDPLDPAGAEFSVKSALGLHRSPKGLVLTGFSARVRTGDTGGLLDARRELRVQKERRDGLADVANGDRAALLAQTMALTNGDPTPFLDAEQDAAERRTKASLDMLRILMGSSNLEGVDTSRVTAEAMRTFFPGTPLADGFNGGVRERLRRGGLRGALNAGGPVVEGEARTTSQAPRGDDEQPKRTTEPTQGDEPRRGSRLRGSASGAPRPTEGG